MFFFASHCSNSRGAAILFNNNFEFKVNKESRDVNLDISSQFVTVWDDTFLKTLLVNFIA